MGAPDGAEAIFFSHAFPALTSWASMWVPVVKLLGEVFLLFVLSLILGVATWRLVEGGGRSPLPASIRAGLQGQSPDASCAVERDHKPGRSYPI